MLERSKTVVVSALKLPTDVMLGEVLVSFVGRHAVMVENYRSIILYTDTLIRLQAKTCQVIVHGSRLRIEYYTKDEMKITGMLKGIEFE